LIRGRSAKSINTRAETITEWPVFAAAYRSNRCLLLA
jgi:putative SOS response-associated peptidase YedK